VKGLRVCGVVEAVADERISVCDLPTEIEGAGASFDELNDFLVNFILKTLGRRNEIDAIRVFGARFRVPCRIADMVHSSKSSLTSTVIVLYLFSPVKRDEAIPIGGW